MMFLRSLSHGIHTGLGSGSVSVSGQSSSGGKGPLVPRSL
jgi:hypothetical protein